MLKRDAAPTIVAHTATATPRIFEQAPLEAVMNEAEASLPRLLQPQAVATMLGVTIKTLERWRTVGGGPRYVKLSARVVRYTAEDVSAFVGSRVKANTAQ